MECPRCEGSGLVCDQCQEPIGTYRHVTTGLCAGCHNEMVNQIEEDTRRAVGKMGLSGNTHVDNRKKDS